MSSSIYHLTKNRGYNTSHTPSLSGTLSSLRSVFLRLTFRKCTLLWNLALYALQTHEEQAILFFHFVCSMGWEHVKSKSDASLIFSTKPEHCPHFPSWKRRLSLKSFLLKILLVQLWLLLLVYWRNHHSLPLAHHWHDLSIGVLCHLHRKKP